ncbi:MAG: tail fiber protein [Flavobacteriaceae bacterium]
MNDSTFSLFNVTSPVGSITAFAGNVSSYSSSSNQQSTSPPSTQPIEAFGWMLCDGSSLSASEYPELYAALGDLYGSSGSGSGLKFNLPDLRGQFLRGVGADDDEASLENRTAAKGGTTTGVGSTQNDALQTHEHTYTEPTGTPAPGENGAGTATVNKNAETSPPITTPGTSDVKISQYETRPVNIFINYLIKYTYKLPKLTHVPRVF